MLIALIKHLMTVMNVNDDDENLLAIPTRLEDFKRKHGLEQKQVEKTYLGLAAPASGLLVLSICLKAAMALFAP